MDEPLPPPEVILPASPVKPPFIRWQYLVILGVLFIGGLAVGWYLKTRPSGSSPHTRISDQQLQNTSGPGVEIGTINLTGDIPKIGDFVEDQVKYSPSLPATPVSVSALENLTNIETVTKKPLTAGQKSALENSGFFVTNSANLYPDPDAEIDFSHGTPSDEFLRLYNDIAGNPAPEKRLPENAVFITTDLAIHAYHVYVDRTIQYIEQTQFQPKLTKLTAALYQAAMLRYTQATAPDQKASLARVVGYFAVPKIILATSQLPNPVSPITDLGQPVATGSQDTDVDTVDKALAGFTQIEAQLPSDISAAVRDEISRIYDAKIMETSALFGKYSSQETHDYTQYKPRSHYTKNSVLRSFWRAMIWYGRTGLLVNSAELTRDAANITLLLASVTDNSAPVSQLWRDIYLPTAFFVGKSDDLGFYDYLDVIRQVAGTQPDRVVSDTATFAAFQNKITALPGPKIQSSALDLTMMPSNATKKSALEATKGFRFMGQRFIPDSFVFSSLTQGDEPADPVTGQQLPPMPTVLIPLSIFGNDRASTYLTNWIAKNAPESDKVIAQEKAKLDSAFAKLSPSDWTINMYWSWIYTLKSLFSPAGSGYPQFMQSPAWADKNLTTITGSWTELRHDTLLYAKQSYAERGGGPGNQPQPKPVPKSYVEPNVAFYSRLIALTKMTKAGLTYFNLLDDLDQSRLDTLANTFKALRDISIKELQNQKLTDDELETLRIHVIGWLSSAVAPRDGGNMQAKDARSGLIADVHTANSLRRSGILYEATGIPQTIYVAISDATGTRLTRGLIYSQYEFVGPLGTRQSDADWQAKIYEGRGAVPPLSDWVAALPR